MCLRCGKPTYFMERQCLDRTPWRDSLLTDTFDVIPSVCKSCGKIEFYEPAYVAQDKYIRYLIWKDQQSG